MEYPHLSLIFFSLSFFLLCSAYKCVPVFVKEWKCYISIQFNNKNINHDQYYLSVYSAKNFTYVIRYSDTYEGNVILFILYLEGDIESETESFV